MTTEPTEPNRSSADPKDRSPDPPVLHRPGIGVRFDETGESKRLNPSGLRSNADQTAQNPSGTRQRTAEERAIRESSGSLRPITPEDVGYTMAFGAELRRLRLAAGVGKRELARLLDLHERTVYRLEIGAQRPRRSTLERMAQWLVPIEEWPTADGPAEHREREIVDHLVDLLGPALAPEREYRR